MQEEHSNGSMADSEGPKAFVVDREAFAAGQPCVRPAESASADPTPSEKPVETAHKLTPAQAFSSLSERVADLSEQFAEVTAFVRASDEKLTRRADEYRQEGARPGWDSLIRLHDIVFRRLQAMEGGRVQPDSFLLNLFQALEGELELVGLSVIRPLPGDDIRIEHMKLLDSVPCPFWRKPERVAAVHSCGFAIESPSGMLMYRKAEVSVYRK